MNSCNPVFIGLGQKMGITKYYSYLRRFGLLTTTGVDLPGEAGSIFLAENKAGPVELATISFGQRFEITPLQLVTAVSAIANGGKLMKPYLVDKVTNASGAVMKETDQEEYKQLMTEEEASQIKEYMKSVVDHGTASVLSGQSYTAAGKTGTAEYSSDKEKDHSWFIGMSNVEDPELVVSVIIESSDGTAKAVNVAKEIFDSYYR